MSDISEFQGLQDRIPERLPPLSLAERDRRWRLIRSKMEERGLDCLAVVAIGPGGDMANIAYLSSIHFPGSGGALLVFPRVGEPSVHMAGNLANHRMWLQAQNWVKVIRPVPSPISYPKATIERLKELDLTRGRVGCVNQADTPHVDASFHHLFTERSKGELPNILYEDAVDLIEEVRLIKSDEEIALIQQATDIGDRAILETAQFAKSGISSRAVYARLIARLVENGSEKPFILWEAGPSPVHGVWVPDGNILQPGHIILNEYTPFVRAYGSQFQRPMAVGFVPDNYKRFFDTARAAYEGGLEALRPGKTIRAVVEAMAKPIESAGLVAITPYFHGMGLSLERPVAYSHFRRGLQKEHQTAEWRVWQDDMERIEIRPGMTIALEPNANMPDQRQGVHIGDTVLVTASGSRRMSRLPMEWFIV